MLKKMPPKMSKISAQKCLNSHPRCSQNARNSIKISKIFWGGMPPDPPSSASRLRRSPSRLRRSIVNSFSCKWTTWISNQVFHFQNSLSKSILCTANGSSYATCTVVSAHLVSVGGFRWLGFYDTRIYGIIMWWGVGKKYISMFNYCCAINYG